MQKVNENINNCPTVPPIYVTVVGQSNKSAGNTGITDVPDTRNNIPNVGQSLSVLEIIKVKRLKGTIETDINEDYCYSFSERAAILEFDAGYSRDKGERMAQDESADAIATSYPELSKKEAKYLLSICM